MVSLFGNPKSEGRGPKEIRNPRAEIRRGPAPCASALDFGTRISALGFPKANRGPRRRCSGVVTLELVVAIGILLTVMLPLAYSFVQEQRLARAYYIRAIAMQIVDGEAEVLAAGGWRAFPQGQHLYPVTAGAATNLPQGRFTLTITESEARLEWRPARASQGGPITRTIAVGEKGTSRP